MLEIKESNLKLLKQIIVGGRKKGLEEEIHICEWWTLYGRKTKLSAFLEVFGPLVKKYPREGDEDEGMIRNQTLWGFYFILEAGQRLPRLGILN